MSPDIFCMIGALKESDDVPPSNEGNWPSYQQNFYHRRSVDTFAITVVTERRVCWCQLITLGEH